MANILAIPLCQLASTFAHHLVSDAPVVLSGILKEQLTTVNTSYKPYFALTDVVEREGWLRIVAHRL